MIRLLVSVVLPALAGVALATGCYKTPDPECAFACSFGTSNDACPTGYSCRPDNLCKREGVADGFACPDTVDGAVVDAPAIDGATDAPTIDGPIDAPDIDGAVIDGAVIDAPMIDAPSIDAPPIDAPTDAATDAEIDT